MAKQKAKKQKAAAADKSKSKKITKKIKTKTSYNSDDKSIEKKVESMVKNSSTNESSTIVGYNATQLQKFKDLKQDLKKKTNKELQDILVQNNQTKTGTKDDLVGRVADGIVLGQIPRCPDCFGGRPKFDYKTGQYYCPGFQDDDHFRACKKTFQLSEIQRVPWVSN